MREQQKMMPLVEYFALLANCQSDVKKLRLTDKYVRKYIAIKVEESHFTAEHASLDQWNEVLKAFDGYPMDSPEKARSALMKLLMTS